MRVLLVDTTLHGEPWPLFLGALRETGSEYPSKCSFSYVDEARFLLPNDLTTRLLTRVLDHITLNVRNLQIRRHAAELAGRSLGYRRHPVHREALNSALLAAACEFVPDVVIVVMGFHIAPATLVAIKQRTKAPIVNYATDDPFNSRLTNPDVCASIPFYDIYACTKKAIMDDVRKMGCRSVHYVPFAYNPSVHFPERPVTKEETRRFASDVAFIGEADADRVPFFKQLAERIPNVNLALYGGMWDRHRATRKHARGAVRGRDFRLALGGTKIAVNLIRRGNRDDHVMRTFEAPACGAFMLNERTPEHLALLQEDREAAYFSSPAELVEKVRSYLQSDAERERMAEQGYRRITSGANTYKDRLLHIMRLCKAPQNVSPYCVN